MKQISILLLLILSFFSFNVLAGNKHLHEAIKQTEQAVVASDAKGVARHAAEAITHAQEALDNKHHKVDASHVDEGIKSLSNAVKEGDAGNLDAAQKAARVALEHLKAGN